MIGHLLRAFGVCAHPHRLKELDGWTLYLVCEACGHRVPVLTRTDEETDRMARLAGRMRESQRAERVWPCK